MKNRKAAVFLLIIILVVAWYEFRPERLVLNRPVHEELPTTKGASPPQAVASGLFHSVAHATNGTATIYRAGDGSRILRFTDFKTSNGPDVHVYMVAANDAPDSESVQRAGFIDLGLIKGNIGDQNYHLGSGVDLSRYRAVSVWCKRFRINFGTAALSADHEMSREQPDFK
jgi:hypothetical protein